MKALEKDRRRRYQTANDFAGDVNRYLVDRPVEAGPPSAWYRFTKYARRNRAALTIAALFGVALIGGTAVSVWQARRARSAAAEATSRAVETKQVVDYLVNDVFGAVVPGKGHSRSVTVGELLDQAEATVGERFRGQPLVEASVRIALARTYRGQIDGGRALPHAVRGAELRARYLGSDHPDTLEALAEQAWAYHPWLPPEAKLDEYLTNVRRMFETHRRVLGPTHPKTLNLQVLLAAFLDRAERFDEARIEAVAAESLAGRALGSDHPVTLFATCVLAWTAFHHGDGDGSEALMRQSFEGLERVLGPLDPGTVEALDSFGLLEINLGRFDKALPLALEGQRRYKALNGIDAGGWNTRVCFLLGQQRQFGALRDFCEGELRELLATPLELDPYLRTRRCALLSSLTSRLSTLAGPVEYDRELVARGYEQMVAVGEQAYTESKTRFGTDHAKTFTSMHSLADAFASARRWPEAIALGRAHDRETKGETWRGPH